MDAYDSPGPGAYSVSGNKANGPAYHMGGRDNGVNRSLNGPGPQYDPNMNAIKPKAPGAGFGKAGRGGNRANDGPGPGNYNQQSSLGKKGFKMGMKHHEKFKGDGPGPGAYA